MHRRIHSIPTHRHVCDRVCALGALFQHTPVLPLAVFSLPTPCHTGGNAFLATLSKALLKSIKSNQIKSFASQGALTLFWRRGAEVLFLWLVKTKLFTPNQSHFTEQSAILTTKIYKRSVQPHNRNLLAEKNKNHTTDHSRGPSHHTRSKANTKHKVKQQIIHTHTNARALLPCLIT